MANISLHYSSNAPLAGTFTAFGMILSTWRRRAKERRELANPRLRALRVIWGSAQRKSSSR